MDPLLDALNAGYFWLKALHIVAVVAWMAGLFYLPRLFVYHADAAPGGEASETFKVMERRLLKAIMNPAMIATWVLGILTAFAIGAWADGWLHAKLLFVLVLTGVHHMLARDLKAFAADARPHGARYYRLLNEVPTLGLILIVLLVVLKPFS
ncbi:MAG: protoporphyrinogen oxidase HemJ [Alphaproteobacteria bacterium]|nr:protoporphyrinogen oxidase HemJ [Alphaproteobacteria bacterium]